MFKIGNKTISIDHPPYIIAELSANHNGSIDLAKKSILAAKESGADAIKIQTYEAHTMTIDHQNLTLLLMLWDGYKLYDLYDEAKHHFHGMKSYFLF